MQKLLCAKELWIPQKCCRQTAYFKLPLIKQSETQSQLKKGLTLVCSDHTSALSSTKVTVKASGHFQGAWHIPRALVGADSLIQRFTTVGNCST